MKVFRWESAKNEKLKELRGISFEEIVLLIEQGAVLRVMRHPNQKKYPKQKIFEILFGDYVFLVPFVETKEEVFLKTIIPSRKATKRFKLKKEK